MTTTPSPAEPLTPAKIQILLNEVRRALAAYADQPERDDIWKELLALRRSVAEVIAGLPTAQKTGPMVEAACAMLHAFEESGAADQPATAEDLALAEQLRPRNWPGLLASMLLVPAWQSPAAPALDAVPQWLWAEYTRWLFYTPKGFAAVGQATAYAAHYLKRLEELAAWGTRNRGSAAVRIALQVYTQGSNCIPLYFDKGSLKRHYELRGKILTIATGVPPQEDLLPLPRDGRRLRVGFVNRHFGPQTETYTTLPMFEHLDPSRFEVLLFAHESSGDPVEDYCRSRAAEFHLLPKDIESQVGLIRTACPDILVFGTNLTAVCRDVTKLSLYRLAPLQVVNNSSCATSGSPQIDLYISGTLTETSKASEHFTERLGLIPGPTHAFNYEVDRADPVAPWTREALGLPADSVVFVTAANYFKVIPEMKHAWAKLLAAVPGSHLLVHPFNPNWSSSYPIKRFCAEFDRVLAEHGVSADRLVVSTNKFPSRADVKELLGVGDIYLDTFPFGGVNSLVDPLELGLPVIAWAGETFRARMGGALLRSLGLDELIVADEASYVAFAASLAADKERRAVLKARIAEAMDRVPVFLDPLAHSDAVGGLLEQAFDELTNRGRQAFRSEPQPLRCVVDSAEAVLGTVRSLLDVGLGEDALQQVRSLLAVQPASVDGRHLAGLALAATGNLQRAVEYMVAAVQSGNAPATVWRDLSLILKRSGDRKGSITALETALRIDQRDVETWYLLGELAREQGQVDMLREVGEVVTALAPNDPRTLAYATKP